VKSKKGSTRVKEEKAQNWLKKLFILLFCYGQKQQPLIQGGITGMLK
jgi:hypothetical protein